MTAYRGTGTLFQSWQTHGVRAFDPNRIRGSDWGGGGGGAGRLWELCPLQMRGGIVFPAWGFGVRV